jgi:hypothetical protein
MEILALGYIGFQTRDVGGWVTMGHEVFGLQLGPPADDGSIYL